MTHELIKERHTGRNLTGALITGAVLTALTVGIEKTATGYDRRQHNKKTRVLSHIREMGRAIYIMPGCRADGEYIGEMLEPHIQHIGTTHHEAYSEEDFDLEDIKQKELEARTRDMGRAAIVYCSSMGGMKFTKSLTDPQYREGFGKVDMLLLDSCPADIEDLDHGTRLAMLASRIFPPSWTVSRLYRGFMRRAARKLQPHSPRVTDDQVRGHKLSSANFPLRAVKYQAEFISKTHLRDIEDGELTDAADVVIYISSEHDRVVNGDNAYKEYNRIFGGKVIRMIDPSRPVYGHADGPENPEMLIELMEGIMHTNEPDTMPLPESTPFFGQAAAA
jgi:hypothetical protein